MKLPLTVQTIGIPGTDGKAFDFHLVDAEGQFITSASESFCNQVARAVNREQALVNALTRSAEIIERAFSPDAFAEEKAANRAALNLYKEGK